MKIRVVKAGSNVKAVQAVSYQNNKRIVIKHFGSCQAEKELKEMLLIANEWIKANAGQLSMFPYE